MSAYNSEAYAVFYHSFRDYQNHFHAIYTDDKLAKLDVMLHDQNEHDGYWFAVRYLWDESRQEWQEEKWITR